MKINNDCCKFLPVTGRNCNELREYSVIKSAAVDEEVKPLFKDDSLVFLLGTGDLRHDRCRSDRVLCSQSTPALTFRQQKGADTSALIPLPVITLRLLNNAPFPDNNRRPSHAAIWGSSWHAGLHRCRASQNIRRKQGSHDPWYFLPYSS